MSTIKNYLSLIKFSHTVFAMPFALIGFFLGVFKLYGSGEESASSTSLFGIEAGNTGMAVKLILVILCMVFARSAAMAFNRYLDRQYDERNPRTAIREIPAGVISAKNALVLTILSSLAFIASAFFINQLCFFLSPVALLVILGYSYTKRFTALCHLVLGLGLSLAPIGSYLAVTGQFDLVPVLFSFAVIFWVSGFDIIYALQDEEFDRSQNLYSIPASVGKRKALRISEGLHILSAACVIIAGMEAKFGLLYWLGFAIFAGMLIYQHSLVKPGDLSRVNIAFMTANGVASVLFAIFVISDLFLNNSLHNIF